MKSFKIISALGIFSILGACAMASTPVTGVLYTNVKAPLVATTNPAGTKVGKATCVSWFGAYGTGDCSISAAQEVAKISKISTVNYESTNFFTLYATFTTVVTGE